MQTFVTRACIISLFIFGATGASAGAQEPASLRYFLSDLAASFAEPTRFHSIVGPTVFDGEDPAAVRVFGKPRIIHISRDQRMAIVLLSASIARDNSGDQTSLAGNWSGLYHVNREAGGWTLGERIPFGVSRIREHHIAVAIDPTAGLTASDDLNVDVVGDNGFPMLLNYAARIGSLTVDGKPAAYDFQNGLLWVNVASGSHRMAVSYSITVERPADGANTAAFGPEAGHVRNQYYWHPFFGFGEENGRAPISVRATIPERYRLALGLAQSERIVDGVRIVEGHSAGPTDAVSMSYDSEWEPRTLRISGVTVTLYAKPDFTPKAEVIDSALTRAVRVLGARFGAPPVDNISIIQGRARGGRGWHFLSNQGIFAGTQGSDPVRAPDFPERVFLGHEVAHLWNHPIGWARNFLGEGWATYAESLILADQYGPDVERQFWRDQARLQRQNAIAMTTTIKEDSRNSGVAYAKGAWILKMVERLVGKESFDNSVRAYVALPLDRGSYEDFLAGFGSQRAKVEQFMAPWVMEKGLPEFQLTRSADKLIITQTGPSYLLPAMDIRIMRRDGSSRVAQIEISGRSAALDLADDDVATIELDPFDQYLLELRFYVLPTESVDKAINPSA